MGNRRDVEFTSDATRCRGWLYPPDNDGRRACIVMAHGFGGTRDAGLEPYAKKFAEAGFAVLLFDYRHFGASDGEPRQLFSISRQLHDWASAITFARGLNGVDPERIALWGTSLSGGHVIVAAVDDGRVGAVSAQCPMMDGWAAAMNFVDYAGLGAFLKLGALAAADLLRNVMGRTPRYVPLIAEPGGLAMMSSHDAASGYEAIAPSDWRNEVAARIALQLPMYRPVTRAERVPCPTLVQVCTKDSLAPPRSAYAAAEELGERGRLSEYDCGHFDIYLGETFERASDEQLTFFREVLPTRAAG